MTDEIVTVHCQRCGHQWERGTGGYQCPECNQANQAKHTPGPWKIEKAVLEGMFAEIIAPGRALAIAHVDTVDGFGHGTSETNARLIAASPELLEACRVLAAHASEHYPHFESVRGQNDIRAARAAIAKATESPESESKQ